MLIATPQHSGMVIDFREVAPHSATVDMFNKSANTAQQVKWNDYSCFEFDMFPPDPLPKGLS